jgi:hypothetical protein
MAHLSLEELKARMRAAREACGTNQASPEQLKQHRELVAACPALVPNLLELARLMLLTDEPSVAAEEGFTEIQQLLEQAVQASERSAPALLELGYFMDGVRNSPGVAEKLLEESAAKALKTLEDAWTALINLWVVENREETLRKALVLGALAEKLFPDSATLQVDVARAKALAVQAGLLEHEQP